MAVFKPAVSGLDELDGDEADHELLRRAAGSGRRTTRSPPTATGRPCRRISGAELAGEPIDPERLRTTARAAGGAADFLVAEGVGGFLVPLTADYLVRDLARDLGLPVVIAASPGLGTINHSLLTIAAVRAVGLEVAAVVLTPWPDEPDEVESSNRSTIAAAASVPVSVLPRIDLAAPAGWPALDVPAA